MNESQAFILALQTNTCSTIKQIPKSDLHNHFVLGGDRAYLKEKTKITITPIHTPLNSMSEMNRWSCENLGKHFDTRKMRQLLIEATFVQAKNDGVRVLEIGEDVWVLDAFFDHDINALIDAFEHAHNTIAPDIELRLQKMS